MHVLTYFFYYVTYHVYFLGFTQEGKVIPRICDDILKWKRHWLGGTKTKKGRWRVFFNKATQTLLTKSDQTTHSEKSKCPVMSYSEFEDHARKIEPLANTDHIQTTCNYLQDMGEVSNTVINSR